MQTESLLFEQPCNEHIRVALRAEHLFKQCDHFIQGSNLWDSNECISSLVDLINLLDRPELRNKLTQEALRILSNLKRMQQTPNVDTSKLKFATEDLEKVVETLRAHNGKFAQSLRENDFLNTIRQHHNSISGISSFSIPSYHLWLQLPPEKRQVNVRSWLNQLADIRTIIQILLNLIRQSGNPSKKVASNGFYQSNLDSQAPMQLIQIHLPLTSQAFPQTSVGRHGLSIHFLEASISSRPMQTNKDVEFQLSCCVL
ncbi:MAG: cell division protein ZapD [Proteobacteria bacterium]|nr:cell division protein ZapD [Pseudomonadota bacterium]